MLRVNRLLSQRSSQEDRSMMRYIDLIGRNGKEPFAAQAAVVRHIADHPPTVLFASFAKPVIALGYKESTSNLNIDKAQADGIEVIRQSSNGRMALFDKDRQLCISVVVRRDHYGSHSLFRSHMGLVMIDGLRRLDIDAKWCGPGVQYGHSSCFMSTGEWDIVGTSGKIVTTTIGHYKHAYVFDTIVALDGTILKINDYLVEKKPGSPSSSISEELQRTVSVDAVSSAFYAAFREHLRIRDAHLENGEMESYEEMLQQIVIG